VKLRQFAVRRYSGRREVACARRLTIVESKRTPVVELADAYALRKEDRMRVMVRDMIVAVISVTATLGVVAYAQDKPAAVLRSTVFDWDSFPVRKTDVGVSR